MAFQRELEGAACESLESVPRGLQNRPQTRTTRSDRNSVSPASREPKRDEPGLGAEHQPESRETARPRQGLTEAPHPAPAAAQAVGQGQPSTEAKPAGTEGTGRRSDSAAARQSELPAGLTDPAIQPQGEANGTEKDGKTPGNSPSGPVLERTSLAAGSARDVAFAVKCSEATPCASSSKTASAGCAASETIGPRASAGVLQTGRATEASTSSIRPAAGSTALAGSAIPASVEAHTDSAGADNPHAGSGSEQQGASAGPGVPSRKLTDAALKEEGTAKSNGMSGKPGTLHAGDAPTSPGVVMGIIAVAAAASQSPQLASNGSAALSAPRGSRESGTVDSPAAPPEPDTVQSTGRIDLRVNGQQSERVDIRLIARGSEVQVTVRAASPGLPTELRGGLQDLMQTLKDSGFHSEAWRPAASDARSASSNQVGAQQERTPGGGQGARDQGSGWQQENRGGRGRQDSPPRWVEELEASSASSRKTNWRELSWRQ